MSFASEIKDELARNSSPYVKDELAALFKINGNITITDHQVVLKFSTENAKTAQKVFKEITSLYQIKVNTAISKKMKLNKSTTYTLQITEKVNDIIQDLNLLNETYFYKIMKSENRIRCYLAGAFLGSGSINHPHTSNYHLEIVVDDESFAKVIMKMMLKLSLTAKITQRRNKYIVYVKKAQEVADFIAKVGAVNAYLKFEDVRLNRDVLNNTNRIMNCDLSNRVRVNVAAQEQLKDIAILEEKIGLKNLDADLLCLMQLRKENPEDSLKELAFKFSERMDKSITKSGINHLFVKIKDLASKYRGEKQ